MQCSSIFFGYFVAFISIYSNVSATSNCKAAGCVGVTIYYETLCGDSMRFINSQLTPSYSDLKDHLDITFVPYGKAQQYKDDTGKWIFSCQHGPSECKGNKGQACGLQAIEKAENSEDKQRLSVQFVNCVMSSTHPSTSIQRCAETSGLTSTTQNLLSDCVSSPNGDDLLAAHGDKTHNLRPNLSFVPTIVINNNYTVANQNGALSNFKKLICNLLIGDDKPIGCSTS